MQYIPAWKIKSRRNFSTSCRFRVALLLHQIIAYKAQLHAGKGMNCVVNAAMVGNITACHTAVGSVHNSITFQSSNISLPKVYSMLNRRKFGNIRNALSRNFVLQIFILYTQKLRTNRLRSANIHQCPQQLLLLLSICRYAYIPIFRSFLQKRFNEENSPLTLLHAQALFLMTCLGQISAHLPQLRQCC